MDRKLYAILFILFVFPTTFAYADKGDIIYDNDTSSSWYGMSSHLSNNYLGFVYSSSTANVIYSINLPLREDTNRYGASYYIWVFKGNITGNYLLNDLVGMSNIIQDVGTSTDEDLTEVIFDTPLYLESSQQYTFMIKPISVYEDDYYLYTKMSSDVSSTTEYWYYSTSTETGTKTGIVGLFGEMYEYDYETDSTIILTAPCNTTSASANRCTAGYSSTTSLDYLQIAGTSNVNMSWTDDEYNLVYSLTDQVGYLVDYGYIHNIPTSSSYDFDTYLRFASSSTAVVEDDKIYFLKICQTPYWKASLDGSEDDSLCAEAIVGYNMDTASTTWWAQQLGLSERTTYEVELPITLDEPDTEANAVWTFFLSKVYNVIGATFPFSLPLYVLDTYNEYNAHFSTSTYIASTTGGFYIGLNMTDFGLPTTTAGIPLSAMAQHAKTHISPELFDIIDYILYGLLFVFLTLRILRGAWVEVYEQEVANYKAEKIRGRARSKYFRDFSVKRRNV